MSTSDPGLRAVPVPFAEEELALLAERAAAHRLPVVEFIRMCALCRLTPLEMGVWHPTGEGEGS